MNYVTKIEYGLWRAGLMRALSLAAVEAVPVCETHEPMINIRHEELFRWGSDLWLRDQVWLRGSVYYKLRNVAERLPSGMYLKIYAAYRSAEEQKLSWQRVFNAYQIQFPQSSDEKIYQKIKKIEIDPDKSYSSYQTGAAVDVTLCNEYGQDIDMGGIPHEYPVKAFKTLTPEQKSNRKLLRCLMQAENFVCCSEKWWHYSCGERFWAVCSKNSCAYYGVVEL